MHGNSGDDDDVDDELLSLSTLRALSAAGVEVVSPDKIANRLHLELDELLGADEGGSSHATHAIPHPSLSSGCSTMVWEEVDAADQSKQLKTCRRRDIESDNMTVSGTSNALQVLVPMPTPERQPQKDLKRASGAEASIADCQGSIACTQELLDSDGGIEATADVHAALAALLFPPSPTNTCTAPAIPAADASVRKARRVTIITIESNSESDGGPGSVRPPVALSATSMSHGKTNATAPESAVSPPKMRKILERAPAVPIERPQSVICLDSSDSEYDGSIGVLKWNPTPRKAPLTLTPRQVLTPIRSRPHLSCSSAEDSDDENACPPSCRPSNATQTPYTWPAAKSRPPPSTSRDKDTKEFWKHRDQHAEKLITELDKAVFRGRLPESLTIVWNARLNTTAGRASWKKEKITGTIKAEVELSTKVIDSVEKLKCTLSHELYVCHIAAWAVEGEMKPAHGPAFKSWAQEIMAARKDIKVTTKHSYEIAYKYQWQCSTDTCCKVYGRHSNSIDPVKSVCGLCKGRLERLDKQGNPIKVNLTQAAPTPARKTSEWSIFSAAAFKRIKADNVGLGMIAINAMVAQEWKQLKAAREPVHGGNDDIAKDLANLHL